MNDITRNTIELVNDLKLEEECSVEISKDNKYIVRINKDGKLKYLGSKYSVERDIEKFINEIEQMEENETIIIFGLGSGEHIKYLVNNLSSANKIFIVEPNAEIVRETLKINEVQILLEDDRIALCILDNKIKKYIGNFAYDYNINDAKIRSFANYSLIFENEYNYLLKQVERVKISKKMTFDIFNTFANEFFNNFVENIFTLVNEEGFYSINQLKNLYRGKPAVIVSAGPSLTKNVHLLKEVQDKFIIISGPRTIGTLIENDITPDFVCSVDPQDKAYTLMEKYIDKKIPLVFMDSSNSKVVKEQKGSRIIVANQGMETNLEQMLGVKVDSLMQGGSVAHFSMGLAAYLGCSTIIFIGQDLAYTNDKFQAGGTYAGEMDKIKYDYEKNKEKWDKDKNHSIYVKDIYGNPVRTSVVLKSYIDEFEELISECDSGIKFINSTEGGAHIDGTEVIPLKETIGLYGVEIINKNFKDIIKEVVIINEEEFTERMFGIIDKLEMIKQACEEGICYSNQMLYFYKDNKKCDLDRVFSELDRIDVVINNRDNFGFLAYSMLSHIERVINNDYFKPKKDETEKELGMRLAERGLFIYLSVCETVDGAIAHIKNQFICESYERQVKNVFLKKNLSKRISELHKEYKNLKEIDLVNDIDLKDEGIMYSILDDGSLLVLHKPIEEINNDRWQLLLGDMEAKGKSGIVHNHTIYAECYKMLLNHSLVLVYEKPLNINENKLLSIKLKREKNTNLYLRFLGEEHLSAYKRNRNTSKIFDDIKKFKDKYFDLIFEFGRFKYRYRTSSCILLDENDEKFCDEEIEITIDVENGHIALNNKIYNVSKHILYECIRNRYFTVCNYIWDERGSEKYEIQSVSIGNLPQKANLYERYYNNIMFLSLNDSILNSNQIPLKSTLRVYKVFSI